jgi:hypothetical protein
MRYRRYDVIAPRLTVDGQHLRKPNGKPITLRGVNWGAWGESTEADADAALALGANCIRLPVARWWGLHGAKDTDARDNDGYAFLRRANLEQSRREIGWITSRSMWVIPFIDSNCGQSGTQSAEDIAYCDPLGVFGQAGRNFFTDYPTRGVYLSVWRHVAALLREVPHVAMLELLPEPLGGRPASASPRVRDFYREVIAAVREVDAETPFLVGPRNGYEVNVIDEAWLPERADVVYTGNLLSGKVTSPDKLAAGIRALVTMRAGCNVPVLVQQVGRHSGDDSDLVAMRSVLEQLTQAKIPFTWWQWKQNTADPTEYGLHFKDGAGGWTAKQAELEMLSASLRGQA